MEIHEIIRNAFIFPSKNLETLSIYAILSVLSGAFTIQGIVTFIFGIIDIKNFIIGSIYIAIAIILGFITFRISIQCIKTGIDLEEKLPDFNWLENLSTGFYKVVITIFYVVIPALIVVFLGLITNIYGSFIYFGQELVSQAPKILMGTASAGDIIYHSAFPLSISLTITISIGLIIFLIFSFLQAMGEARLAHTGSLKQALNLYQSAKDLSKIGVGKVILLSALIVVIFIIIESVLTFVFNYLPVLSILTIIITPYFALFAQRSLGLLYSEIV